MIAAQRRNVIIETIERDGAVSISALSERLETSAVTIRRDLDQLADEGRLTRTHGGAVPFSSARESSYAEKLEQALAEKSAIARAAAKHVRTGDVVALGPGTTTELLAKELSGRSGIRIVTNSSSSPRLWSPPRYRSHRRRRNPATFDPRLRRRRNGLTASRPAGRHRLPLRQWSGSGLRPLHSGLPRGRHRPRHGHRRRAGHRPRRPHEGRAAFVRAHCSDRGDSPPHHRLGQRSC